MSTTAPVREPTGADRQRPRVVVLDDDPTGTQAAADVPVVLDWSDPARLGGPGPVYVLTNTRALEAAAAADVVAEVTTAATAVDPAARVVLRGDSALRGHLLAEFEGLRRARRGLDPVVLLVPALPAAGRVTRDGTHVAVSGGGTPAAPLPLHRSEFATDPAFGYSSARLVEWADERSGGWFAAVRGRELPRERLRREGPDAVAAVLLDLHRAGRPAVFGPDVETDDDLALVAEGLRRAEALGAAPAVRCAPPFAAVLAGCAAVGPAPAPPVGRLLVVCGSFVPRSSRQLARLVARHPGALVEVVPAQLTGGGAGDAASVENAVAAARERLHRVLDTGRVAVLATTREAPGADSSLDERGRVATALADVVAGVAGRVDAVVTKGGVTSAVTVRHGLGAGTARVVGPVAPGVALWDVPRPGRPLPVAVFPGNVGDDDALADLVALLLGRTP